MSKESELLIGLTDDELEALADIQLAPSAQTRLDELLARNAVDQLSQNDRVELDRLLARVDQLTILKTRATNTLRPQAEATGSDSNAKSGPEGQPRSQSNISKSKPELTLLLSGGGYRAAAFHLGVLRWLYEHTDPKTANINQLETVTRVVGVSGGSFTAAHFYCNSAKYCTSFEDAAKGLVDFLQNVDMRREILKRKRKAEEILKDLFNDLYIKLPDKERKIALEILGTDVNTGECIVFNGSGIATYTTEKDGTVSEKLFMTSHAPVSVECVWPPDSIYSTKAS